MYIFGRHLHFYPLFYKMLSVNFDRFINFLGVKYGLSF